MVFDRTQALVRQNHQRLQPALPIDDWRVALDQEHQASTIEIEWIESQRILVKDRAADAPRDALRWFIRQEVAGEAGFDDLVALAQVKIDDRPKLEMARNYWDEMGRGSARGMHGPLLAKTASELEVNELKDSILDAPLELANFMSAFAHHRRYAYHAIGALGVIELTAPGRAAQVYRGLTRVGMSPAATQYYLLHSTLDVKHSEAWNTEVLAPLVEAHPETAWALAEGALLRLEAGKRCFDAYRKHLC